MGLFSKKKKEESISPPLPRMPNFGYNQPPELPEFPDDSEMHYEPTIADIKNEVGKDDDEAFESLEDVRTEEEEKLSKWKKGLQDIKEKLLSINEELFEV